MTTVLQIKNLRKTYADVVALDDLSLSADRGEIVALQGASGSGKSTALYASAGLISADQGSVNILSDDIQRMSQGQRTSFRAKHIGLVFQDSRLIPYLDLIGNITLTGVSADRARELLDQVGLSDRLHHKPSQLSSGEQQRCAIARAIAHQPPLILADEPTGNLDADNTELILDLLENLASNGHAILIASHDSQVIARCTRAVSMQQ